MGKTNIVLEEVCILVVVVGGGIGVLGWLLKIVLVFGLIMVVKVLCGKVGRFIIEGNVGWRSW